MLQFKDEFNKVVDFGQYSQTIERKGGVKKHEYNTFMDNSYGKKKLDPYVKQKQRIMEEYQDLDVLEHIYVHGDPGSGKSFLCDLFYETLDIGDRKVRMHYNDFLLKVHEKEHEVNKKLKGKTGETIAIVGNELA